jgi:hypothetical protein
MTTVFSEQAPLLDITSENAHEAQKANEREGFMYLFMGAAQALRNTRGHGPKGKSPGVVGFRGLRPAGL